MEMEQKANRIEKNIFSPAGYFVEGEGEVKLVKPNRVEKNESIPFKLEKNRQKSDRVEEKANGVETI